MGLGGAKKVTGTVEGGFLGVPGRFRWKSALTTTEARFGRKSLAVYERMVGRYVLLLRSSVTNEIIRDVGLDTLMGNWRLHLLFHDAILEGGDGGCEGGEQRPLQTIAAYVETLKSPQSLVERAKRMDDARLLDLIGLLRPDDLRFEDLKFRYVRDLKQRPDRRGFITNVLEMDKGGFYSMLKFLLAQQPLTPLQLPFLLRADTEGAILSLLE
eukprot:g20323.t1